MGSHAWQRWGCLLAHEPGADLAYCRCTGNMNGEQKRRGFFLLRIHNLYPYVPLSCPAPPGLPVGNEK